MWTLLSSHSGLVTSGVVAVIPTRFVGGFVGNNSILSNATGSSHHKHVYYHPNFSLPPPAQKCIQAGRAESEHHTLPFWHRKDRAPFCPFHHMMTPVFHWGPCAWWANQSRLLSTFPLSPAPTQLCKQGKAKLCSAAAAAGLRSNATPSAEAQLKLIFQNTSILSGWFAQSSLCPLILFHRYKTFTECTAGLQPEQWT